MGTSRLTEAWDCRLNSYVKTGRKPTLPQAPFQLPLAWPGAEFADAHLEKTCAPNFSSDLTRDPGAPSLRLVKLVHQACQGLVAVWRVFFALGYFQPLRGDLERIYYGSLYEGKHIDKSRDSPRFFAVRCLIERPRASMAYFESQDEAAQMNN